MSGDSNDLGFPMSTCGHLAVLIGDSNDLWCSMITCPHVLLSLSISWSLSLGPVRPTACAAQLSVLTPSLSHPLLGRITGAAVQVSCEMRSSGRHARELTSDLSFSRLELLECLLEAGTPEYTEVNYSSKQLWD